jgi:hypothetical protein
VEESFVEHMMARIMEGLMIPKVQTERAVGPILEVFLETVLTQALGADPELSGPLVMICSEFPLRKPDNLQSTNIDWLMYNRERSQLLFVELKTSDTSVAEEQAAIYRDKKEAVGREGGAFLIEDVRQLRDVSSERGKYDYVLKNKVQPLAAEISACRDMRILYLMPETTRAKVEKQADRVLCFSDLPWSIAGPYAQEWPVIRSALCLCDSSSKKTRNQKADSANDGANYAGRVDFDSIVNLCREDGDRMVVGFNGGARALRAADLSYLERRLYKWDMATDGVGVKVGGNWIAGSLFLAALDEVRAARAAERSEEAPMAGDPSPRS